MISVIDRTQTSALKQQPCRVITNSLPITTSASPDGDWLNRIEKFAAKTAEKEKKKEKASKSRKSVLSLSSEKKKALVKSMFRECYRRHHPRRVILDFFNDVAREGAHDIEIHGTIKTKTDLHPMLRYFNRASVFTVWRPTSMDAMIRMIRHEAIGKGLDIKGKSALRGDLSGFVPFLQISNNEAKKQIRELPEDGVIRLFFKSEDDGGNKTRDKVAKKLKRIADSMSDVMSLEIMRSISNETDPHIQLRLLEQLEIIQNKCKAIQDCPITYIDDYTPIRFGLEFPVLLFWHAFVASKDITREPGSKYDIGRDSCLTSQDWNLSTLCSGKNSDHRVVLLQTASVDDDPMNPFELLMAYELDQRREVLPVVSDCDCFLVGTRRVTYTTAIEPYQMDVMKWCVKQIENVLENSTPAPGTSTTTTNDDDDSSCCCRSSWKDQWYDLLHKAVKDGFKPSIPRIGFGDPKSCSIMENAVKRLTGSGGVRHGAESFNYYIPQDLENEFVVIGEGLPGDVAWIKVSQEELQNFLYRKIDEGFTFPLNPKWILSDSGKWKTLYDKLLTSKNENTINSMSIWFPPESGIREQITRISERFPNGFERK